MNPLAKFMASPAGRGARVVAGLVLIALGLFVIGGTGGIIVAVIGLVPLAAGVLDFCLLGPLLGTPLRGIAVRRGRS